MLYDFLELLEHRPLATEFLDFNFLVEHHCLDVDNRLLADQHVQDILFFKHVLGVVLGDGGHYPHDHIHQKEADADGDEHEIKTCPKSESLGVKSGRLRPGVVENDLKHEHEGVRESVEADLLAILLVVSVEGHVSNQGENKEQHCNKKVDMGDCGHHLDKQVEDLFGIVQSKQNKGSKHSAISDVFNNSQIKNNCHWPT